MSDGDSGHYPNLPVDGLGEFKKLKRLPNMRDNAPEITWGKEFATWPPQRRARYAMRLASSMNHAADILQTERNEWIENYKGVEAQLKATAKAHDDLLALMNAQLAKAGGEKQKLYEQIVELTNEVVGLKRAIQKSKAAE